VSSFLVVGAGRVELSSSGGPTGVSKPFRPDRGEFSAARSCRQLGALETQQHRPPILPSGWGIDAGAGWSSVLVAARACSPAVAAR
jgi:hypothetical protein